MAPLRKSRVEGLCLSVYLPTKMKRAFRSEAKWLEIGLLHSIRFVDSLRKVDHIIIRSYVSPAGRT